ncbi:MAG: TatD family hydrolase [Thermoplasmata archaeon]|nr:TatD family hydrolase [Thermoplasmata archaeon]
MPLPRDLPIVDHHCHLSPNGEGVAAARRFRDAGGTHLFLATQNYRPGAPTTLADYVAQFDTTESLAEQIRRETEVVVYPVLAPYPVDLIGAAKTLGLEAAAVLQESALDLAGHRIEEGRAVALGEVGRPHFPVEGDIQEMADRVFRRALEVARDVGCPAVVHCADLDGEGYRELAAFTSRSGFPLGRLIKHYARSSVPAEERAGIVPSYLAKSELVATVASEPSPWFLETDFLDDPRRPGAVLDLATVPRRATRLVELDPAAADRLRIPFESAVATVYGFTPIVDRQRSP